MQIFLSIIVILINLFLCILVFTRVRDTTPRYFALSALFVVIWGMGTLAMLFGRNLAVADSGLATFCLAPMTTAFFMVLFSASFVGASRRTITSVSLVLGVAFVSIAAYSLLHLQETMITISTVPSVQNSIDFRHGWFVAYSSYFSVSFSVSYFFFIRGYFKRRESLPTIVPVFVGIFATSFLALVTNIVLPLLGVNELLWLGPIWTLFYISTTSFAMVRHRLFDIRLIVVRTLGYVLSIFTLAAVYVFLGYIVSLFFIRTGAAHWYVNPLNVVFALVLAFIFQPVKGFFDRITNRIFYRERYNPEEFYALLSTVLSSTVDLRDLVKRTSEVIAMTFKAKQASFFVRLPSGGHVSAGTPGHAPLLVNEAHALDELAIDRGHGIIAIDNLNQGRTVYGILKRHNIALLLPLWHDGKVLGYLSLGEGLSGYAHRDYRVLETIADELVIAIGNVLSLEEVRDINENLQDRIDAATRSLLQSNAKLRKLDDAKDEFISMASHQLRTPLTSIKGYISMILDGDAGEITEQQQKFLTEAFESSNRMTGIIGDFLNVSRLQTGKFMLEKTRINLAEIAEREVEQLQNTARLRGMQIRYKKPKKFPDVIADQSKIEQVMMNFMDNALFYAPNSKTVEVELVEDGGKATFTVRDHGIGVPKAEQANLFTKFFRATNARRQRPDGTGVGIFLAKRVISAHHGDIIFKSTEGEGSTFGFTLPLMKQADNAAD